MKKTILIASSSFSNESLNFLIRKTKGKFNIIKNTKMRKLTSKELFNIIKKENVIATIAGLENYNESTIKNSNLKVISRIGSGLSNIDITYTKKKNIKVYSTPTAPVNAVAELTISMMIYLIRNIEYMNIFKTGKWDRKIGKLLYGKSVFIIGMGNIGSKVFKLLKPFNAKVSVFDKVKNNKYKKYYTSLKSGLKGADIITIHVNQDIEILGKKELKLLKKDAVILNSSRGQVLNENELIMLLKEKQIGGAWIDVYNKEPYKGPLTKIKGNIITTPHIGSHTIETRKEMEFEAINNLFYGIGIR